MSEFDAKSIITKEQIEEALQDRAFCRVRSKIRNLPLEALYEIESLADKWTKRQK